MDIVEYPKRRIKMRKTYKISLTVTIIEDEVTDIEGVIEDIKLYVVKGLPYVEEIRGGGIMGAWTTLLKTV